MPEIDVCALEELPPAGRGGKSLLVDGEPSPGASAFFKSMLPPGKTRISVFRVDADSMANAPFGGQQAGFGDGVFACEDRCPHADAALSTGQLKQGVLTCGAHGFGFDLLTGSCHMRGPKPLVRYPVRVVDGRVLVTL